MTTAVLTRRRWRWLLWLVVVLATGAGLARYRIDNDMARWMPEMAGSAIASTFIIVGADPHSVELGAIATRLAADDRAAVALPFDGDGGMSGLLVIPAPEVPAAELREAVREALGSDAARVALGGPAEFAAALDDFSQRGLPLATGLILIIGVIVLLVTTRSPRRAIESAVAVFSSQIVLVGLIAWTNTPMDMMLSMAPPLMMGLGFSYAAHRATRTGIVQALRLSAVTTALGIGAFVITDFAPIRTFALWGALGIAITFSSVMLLVMPLGPGRIPPTDDAAPPQPSRLLAAVVVTIGLGVTLAGLLLIPRVRLEDDSLCYFPPEARIVRDHRALNDELTGMLPFEIIIGGGDDPTALLLATPGVRRVLPLPLVVAGDDRHYLALADNDALTALGAAAPRWHAWADERGTTLRWSGVAAQLHAIGDAVIRSAATAFPAMILIAAIAAWIADRRWQSVLLGSWVNLFPVAVLILIVAAMDRPVGLPTLMIGAIAIGVAVDDTLHILLARRACGSMVTAVRRCRRACVGSSVAAAACMLAFLICPFRPTAEFGGLLAGAITAAAIGDLVLLPSAAR